MVTTRAQEASASQAPGNRPFPDSPEANRFAPPPADPQVNHEERFNLLSNQMQELMATMRGLQEQCLVNAPVPPQQLCGEGRGTDPALHGRTPPEASQARPRSHHRETSKRRRSTSRRPERSSRRHGQKEPKRIHSLPRHSSSPSESTGGNSRASPRPHRRKTARRHRSPSHRSGHSLGRREREEMKRGRSQPRRPSSPSSGSSGDSHDPKTTRHAERRLDQHQRRLDELTRRIIDPQGAEYDHRPPLCRRITEQPVPPRFRLPQLDPYDGTTDPLDHLESYKVLMQVQGATDALLCIAFPATLKKAARAWYSRLPPRSISSFKQLERSFLAHFDACRKIPRVADSLFAVQQKVGETLKDFVARFKEAALEVYNLEDSVATLALKRGLRPSRFAYSLDKKPPRSYSELLVRAQKYIRAEEADSSRREADKGSTKKPTPAEPATGRSRKPESSRRTEGRPPTLAPRESFTPLLAPISHILMEIEDEPYLRRPPPLRAGAPRNKDTYCRYHRDYGHDTEDCRLLKKAIEELVQQGHLGKFVRRANPAAPGPAAPPAPRANIDNTPTEKTVAMISWGADRNPKRQREGMDNVIPFSREDLDGIVNENDDSVVVSMTVAKHPVRRILVDSGSSVNILNYDAFVRMNLTENSLRPVATPLMGFTGDSVGVEGEITLPVTAGTPPRQNTVLMSFLVVRVPLAYNAILGRPGLNLLDAIISTKRLLVRFPTDAGVGEMRGEQNPPSLCYHLAPSPQGSSPLAMPEPPDPRDLETRAEPAEHLLTFPLAEDPTQTIQIGALLPDDVRDQLLTFLRTNADVFAWSSADMPGVPEEVITHRLNIKSGSRPVRQKKRSFAPDRQQAIAEEIRKLEAAGHIREVHYPDWLANVVMVRKANGSWRMCVDFTDLNKACPKDSFPLPRIDQLVDATSGHEILSFMDAFSGYNQIKMNPADEEATSFVTEKGTFCYRVMPFGLKNAGATYQRLMGKVFEHQIGRNMEVYVDDMLTKSICTATHVADLTETFDNLRRHRMKLNPRKCAFGVTAGKFLGFMVTRRGIEANPDKIQAVLNMKSPTNKKEVQRLTGKLAALSRFLSRSAERCQPFFKALRKMDNFEWNGECQKAFEGLKQALSTPPLLSKPKDGEELLLYLAVSAEAVSSVLVRLDAEGRQQPVYYTSKVLHDAETRYSNIEKIIFALIISAQRLRPYFQAHSIAVITDQPLKTVLSRPDTSGRLAKWAVKLGEFDISFRPRSAMKSQVLADFLVECSWSEERPVEIQVEQAKAEVEEENDDWVMHVDGASNSQGSGAGLILTNPDGVVTEYALRFLFPATNNQAEYEALLCRIRLARELGIQRLRVFTDSQLVSGQIKGEYEARDSIMSRYLSMVRTMVSSLARFSVDYIPRKENSRADALSRLATSAAGALGRTFMEHLEAPSIEIQESMPICHGPSWMDVYTQYLTTGALPADPAEAKIIKWKAHRFLMFEGHLYRRSFSHPLLKCVGPDDADYILREIHEGICGNHLGGRALSRKALRQGYYWPTMREDATELVKKCDSCQRHANVQHLPTSQLSPLSAPWPFAQWGMDILGPFPPATGQRKFLLVAIDHFTKWVEAEALAKITETKVRNFFWKSVICRFGLPHTIITDNGRQFDCASFRQFCAELGIRQRFTSVGHPQTNGATEVTNRTILQGLRTRLDGSKGRWVEELPNVLWAYHTTPRVPTGETPFSLVFGSEAVIPVEVGTPSPRMKAYNEEDNPDQIRASLDLIEELRDQARLRMASYRQRIARYYNSRVRPRVFLPGDLVLRRAEISKPTEGGKLSPKWEGPYRVTNALHRGAYQIEELDGKLLPRTWSADNLRQYYQ